MFAALTNSTIKDQIASKLNLFIAYAPITRMRNSIVRFMSPFLPILKPLASSTGFYELKGPDFDTFSE